jgi:hypothetical protein
MMIVRMMQGSDVKEVSNYIKELTGVTTKVRANCTLDDVSHTPYRTNI